MISSDGKYQFVTPFPAGRFKNIEQRISNIEGSESSYAKGFVNHGADATVIRPAGYASIEWMGSVTPNNMINGDTLIITT